MLRHYLIRSTLLPLIIFCFAPSYAAATNIYIYQKPDGEKVISNRPLYDKSLTLIHRNGELEGAGNVLANRQSPTIKTLVKDNKPKTSAYDSIIHFYGRKYTVDNTLIKAVIQAESNFDRQAISKKGAKGLMQLMPNTASIYNKFDLFDPHENIEAGTAHLKYLLGKYDDLNHVLAAYNAGETAVNKYNGIPPYEETQNYVKKVLKFQAQYQ